jgi:hypothetical protein
MAAIRWRNIHMLQGFRYHLALVIQLALDCHVVRTRLPVSFRMPSSNRGTGSTVRMVATAQQLLLL